MSPWTPLYHNPQPRSNAGTPAAHGVRKFANVAQGWQTSIRSMAAVADLIGIYNGGFVSAQTVDPPDHIILHHTILVGEQLVLVQLDPGPNADSGV
jgi:hypothetical protein